MLQGVACERHVAAGRHPAQRLREYQYHQGADDEHRHGERERRQVAADTIKRAVAPDCREQSAGDAEQHGEDGGHSDQFERARQAASDLAGDGAAILQRLPQVAAQQMAEVVDVLGQNWAIEPKLLMQFGHGGRIGRDTALRQQQFCRIAWHQADSQEHDGRDGPDQQDGNADAPRNPEHQVIPALAGDFRCIVRSAGSGLFQRGAGVEGQRAGKVMEAGHLFAHRVALCAEAEADDRCLIQENLLQFGVDRVSPGIIEFRASCRQQFVDLRDIEPEAADVRDGQIAGKE